MKAAHSFITTGPQACWQLAEFDTVLRTYSGQASSSIFLWLFTRLNVIRLMKQVGKSRQSGGTIPG